MYIMLFKICSFVFETVTDGRNPTPSHTLSRWTEFPEPPRGNQNPTNAKSRVSQRLFREILNVNSMSPKTSIPAFITPLLILLLSTPRPLFQSTLTLSLFQFLTFKKLHTKITPKKKKWIRIRKVFRFYLMFWPDFLLSDPGPNPEFLRPMSISSNRPRRRRNR